MSAAKSICKPTKPAAKKVSRAKPAKSAQTLARFTLIGADQVRDNATGLIWTRSALGKAENHAGAEAMAQACAVGGATSWRLPTVEELFLLADRTKYRPAIDTEAFADTKSDFYWSSSAYAAASGGAWGVYFSYGNSGISLRSYYGFVRAVRGPVLGSARSSQ